MPGIIDGSAKNCRISKDFCSLKIDKKEAK